ncbi:MAG: hypothetical protein HYR90_04810 [Candidatus Andersenbacteria bacterium]|nr:hypothetical protein [Candidatus Andersenbacteria bacterium]
MEEIKKEVKPVAEPSPAAGPEPEVQPAAPVVVEPVEPQKPPKGYVPYQALEEERRLRKEAQEEAERLRSTPPEVLDEEVFSDEGKALKGDIQKLNEKLRAIERKDARREAEIEFPFLKDKREEFDTFLEDEENKRLSIRKAAQLFAAEKGLLENPPERKGLEKPTGGGQVLPEPKFTAEEIRDMMKNDWKRYEKLLKEGKI